MRLQAKDPDVNASYEIDWQNELIATRLPSADYDLTDLVVPRTPTGYIYECTTAGRTSGPEPALWPRIAGLLVNDGSCVWTARAPADVTPPTITVSTWTIPTGLTEASSAIDGVLTRVELAGGVDGVDYVIVCRVTLSTGDQLERAIVVPVRQDL